MNETRKNRTRKKRACLASRRQGFTLIELLTVIAIIAVLSVVVILTINPVEILKRGRDSSRLSDFATLTTALQAYATDIGGSMGSSATTYLSIPDPTATTTAGSNCVGIGFPGGSFRCAASSTYKNVDGTGWIPVNLSQISFGSPIGALPVDPTNQSLSYLYYTYQTNGSTFKIRALPESQRYAEKEVSNPGTFSSGSNLALGGGNNWALVPGNSAFGTPNFFYVMKYDAVCSDGNGKYLNDYDSGYSTYSDSAKNCTPANGRAVAALPGGWPVANISHTNALSRCQSIGAHLLTNDEYMTIVRNAEQVNSNWSGGSPGSGYMYSGHNDNSPATGLTASADDSDGYFGTLNTTGNQRRTLALSNSSVVWDFAGNVWQHVQRSVNNSGDLTTTMALPACSDGLADWGWCDFATAAPYISAWSSDVAQAKVAPSDSSWYASQGMGRVYTFKNGVNQGTTVFLRGAAWGNGSYAGPFALNLDWVTGTAYYGVGFRCAR